MLGSWRDGTTKEAVFSFVGSVSSGLTEVPLSDRVAVFDNDGTLWCEKPMPIQLDFILRRLVDMAETQPDLRQQKPWKAAHERDYHWLGSLVAQHYAGDDTNVKVLLAGILAAYDGMSVDEFEAQSEAFLRGAQHPSPGRGYLRCAYGPMVELLRYLEANGFANYCEARIPRRRPPEADSDLESHRSTALAGGRQFQRRHHDAGLHSASGQAFAAAAHPPR
jgi:hypothetical protein